MGTQQVAQLAMPHRLVKELQASDAPTGVETDSKNPRVARRESRVGSQSVARDKSFMDMKARDHREAPIHVGYSRDSTSTLIVFKPL